jgi:ubiquinone/menaquinone biosynthesis C-methylase UbiE
VSDPSSASQELQVLYQNRFGQEGLARTDLWEVLCRHFFQKWVPATSTVLDVAAGHCEFINNIEAGRKIAVDLNPDVAVKAAPGVETHVCRSDEMKAIEDGSIDRVFISNFFEHVPREVIASTLVEVLRVLKPGGQLLVLQPNIRFAAKDYWMFFDHITAVDDRALVEVMEAVGYVVDVQIPRFLPYTTKSRLPATPMLVRWYLRMKPAWRIFGAQAFIVGRRPEA